MRLMGTGGALTSFERRLRGSCAYAALSSLAALSAVSATAAAGPAATVAAAPSDAAERPSAPDLTPDLTVEFEPGGSDLGIVPGEPLRSVLRRLAENPRLRVEILAYADLPGEGGRAARRLSLSRALAMRSRLIEEGVPDTRIDIRALGGETDRLPKDRLDLVVVQP